MHLPKYHLTSDIFKHIFKFTSVGVKGNIEKGIHFEKTASENVVNLAFGDVNKNTGKIDDEIISNNGDRDKILATVFSALYIYTSQFPEHFVTIKGSTQARTRLYRMAITVYGDEFIDEFTILGLTKDKWSIFKHNNNYSAFLVKRKIN